MNFKNTTGNTVSLSIDNAREDLSELEVKAAMNTIIETDTISSKSGKIVSALSAKIVEQSVRELKI